VRSSIDDATPGTVSAASAWTLSGQATVLLIQLGAAAPLSRLLAPRAFGVWALATFSFTLIGQMIEVGGTSAVTRSRELRQEDLSTIHWLGVGASTCAVLVVLPLLFLIVRAVAPFNSDNIRGLLAALSIPLLATGWMAVPRGLLIQRGRFRAVAHVDVISYLVSYTLAVFVALLTRSVWALYVQLAAVVTLRALQVWILSRWRPSFTIHGARLREQVEYARGIYVFNVLVFATRNVDNLIVGAALGTLALGVYSRAFSFLLAPLVQMQIALSGVAIRTFASYRANEELLRASFARFVERIGLVTLPLGVLIAVTSIDVVQVLFGSAWDDAVPLVRSFGIVAALQLVVAPNYWFLQASGQTALMRRMGAINIAPLLAVCIGVAIGSLKATALAYGVLGGPVMAAMVVLAARRETGVKLTALMRLLWRAAAGAVAAGGMAGATMFVLEATPPPASLVAAWGVGLATCAGVTWCLGAPGARTYMLWATRAILRGRQRKLVSWSARDMLRSIKMRLIACDLGGLNGSPSTCGQSTFDLEEPIFNVKEHILAAAVHLRLLALDRSGWSLIRKVRGERLTYLPPAALRDLRRRMQKLEKRRIAGSVIEAGCALGGSAVVLAASKSKTRPMYIYDVFGTIPPPSDVDGEDVVRRFDEIADGRSHGIGGDRYYGYQENLLAKVTATFSRFGLVVGEHRVQLIKGLFQDTIQPVGPVAFAHIDGDWYESVKVCLERIWPVLVIGGVVVIDDYDHWTGCRTAVDEFLLHRTDFHVERWCRLHLIKLR
jgi:O-antigen/teichoic acid export membrane protein